MSIFASAMKIYIVYRKKSMQDEIAVIKSGFSLYAMFFGLFWALYHKMWSLSIVILLFNIIAGMINSDSIFGVNQVITIFGGIMMGVFAQDLREYFIQKKGYAIQDIICAGSEVEAELKFLSRS